MGYAKHVGRVGALAFALGVGIGVGVAPGAAWADDTGNTATSTPGETSTPTDADAGPADEDRADVEEDDGDEDDQPVEDEVDVEQQADADVAPEPTDEIHIESSEPDDTRRRTGKDSNDPSRTSIDHRSVAVPLERAQPASSDATMLSAPDTAVAADVTSPDTRPTPTTAQPVTMTAVEEPAEYATTSIPSATYSTLPQNNAPGGAPVTSTAMWVLAAAARRELDATNTAPTAGLAYLIGPGFFTSRVRGDIYGRDADRDPLTYNASSPTNGSVTVNPYGNFTYTPTSAARHAAAATDGTAVKTDTFVITVSDGNGGTAIVPVNVSIKPANARPVARSTVGRPDPVSGTVTGAITISDRDGDVVTYSAPAATARGSVAINSDGTFTYTPTADARDDAKSIFRRLDRFVVTVDDGHGGIDTTTVYVRIAPPPANSAPSDEVVTVNPPDSEGVVTGTVTATDVDQDTLIYAAGAVTPARGALVVDDDGFFTYTPTPTARHAAAA
ncbi:MAG: Ig-like domain-containing protein [Mycobacterium sp.]|nr:Ig-like domain-containing protein [Mycobacterium sp.]